jgi:hypothetical protein
MTNNQKLELAWIGKENQPRLERLLELEGKEVWQMKACWKSEHKGLL